MSPTRRTAIKRQTAQLGITLSLGVIPWNKLGILINQNFAFASPIRILLPFLTAILGGVLWWLVLEHGTLKQITERMRTI